MVTLPDRRKLFVRMADGLRHDIAAGRYPVGEPFPSIRDLVERFGAAKATVERALDVLRDEGLLESRQGSRTVVVAVPDRPAEAIEPEAYSEEFQILYRCLLEIRGQMRDVLDRLGDVEEHLSVRNRPRS